VGCGGQGGIPKAYMKDVVQTCHFPGLKAVYLQIPANCATIEHNFHLGGEILQNHNILTTAVYNHFFDDVDVIVMNSGCVDAPGFPRETCAVIGISYDEPPAWIMLANHMSPLLHELLHNLDYNLGVSDYDNYHHVNWDIKGYLAADSEFRREMIPIY